MDIKVERIYRLEGEGPLKAFVDISIDDSILIKGLKIITGKQGLLVAMPKKQAKDGQYYSIFQALNAETKEKISEVVFQAYEE